MSDDLPARFRVISLHDREAIASVLARDPLLNLYAIGDLDDRFWPYTTWFGYVGDDAPREIAFLYIHDQLPVLIALSREPVDMMRSLVAGLIPVLPRRVYTHTSPGVIAALARDYRVTPHGLLHRMSMEEPSRLEMIPAGDAVPLGTADLDHVRALYRDSYPGNWFDPWMIETGCYFGIRREGALVCVAGVHVASRSRRVAALGNIATRPEHRGRGLAATATAALCRHLRGELGIDRIGLNVKADNVAAISCYTRLGFRAIASFEESMCETIAS
jgi:RimJ/RimL family protein N-acetyltransferase